MASAAPLRDQLAATAAVGREAYRRAHELTSHLADALGELEAWPDSSQSIPLHESARLAVGTIVRLLAGPAGAVAAAAELDAWVQVLDELLTDAQAGVDGGHGRGACVPPLAEALAWIVKVHQVANRALGQAATPVLDPERLWHADLARDALVLLHRLPPVGP
jgi:hypothetical protein